MKITSQSQHLNNLDCIMICTLISHALDGSTMKKLCRKFKCGGERAGRDPNFAFYTIHHECHQQDSKLKNYLETSFNRRFATTIKAVRALPDLQREGLSAEIRDMYKADSGGVLWALLTDPRESFQNRGIYLIHTSALRKMQQEKEMCSCSNHSAPCTSDHDRKKDSRIKQLEKTIEQQSRSIERLTTENSAYSKDVEQLKSQPDTTVKYERKIRKLEYELEKLRTAVVQRTTKPEQVPERQIITAIDGDESCSLSCDNECNECPLNQLKVAIVGGIDRMMPKYKSIVSQLGGELLYHNGKCSGRRAIGLRSNICGADIVVFITTINSHNALNIAKAECKKTGKKFVVMRETSPTRLKHLLSHQSTLMSEITP